MTLPISMDRLLKEFKIMTTREEMLSVLHSGICKVIFTKADGTKRIMKCTLSEEFIPHQEPVKASKKPRRVNEEVIRVFDIESEAWRSFVIDSVESLVCEESIKNEQ